MVSASDEIILNHPRIDLSSFELTSEWLLPIPFSDSCTLKMKVALDITKKESADL